MNTITVKKPEERAALRDAGAIAFYLAKPFNSLRFIDQAWHLLKYWQNIADTAERTKNGQCYLVKMNGGIEVLPL